MLLLRRGWGGPGGGRTEGNIYKGKMIKNNKGNKVKAKTNNQIDNSKFYSIGKWVFFTVAVMNLAAGIDMFGELPGTEIVIKFAMVLFYLVGSAFFSFLANQAKAMKTVDEDLEEMNKALQELEVKK